MICINTVRTTVRLFGWPPKHGAVDMPPGRRAAWKRILAGRREIIGHCFDEVLQAGPLAEEDLRGTLSV
jgi:hypothetical protein